MRFLKQTTDYDCVPVAIINALRWQHRKTPSIVALRRTLKTTKATGTLRKHWIPHCHEIGFPKLTSLPGQVSLALRNGDGILIGMPLFINDERCGHAFFIPRATPNAYYCVNSAGGHRWLPRYFFAAFDWSGIDLFLVPRML